MGVKCKAPHCEDFGKAGQPEQEGSWVCESRAEVSCNEDKKSLLSLGHRAEESL